MGFWEKALGAPQQPAAPQQAAPAASRAWWQGDQPVQAQAAGDITGPYPTAQNELAGHDFSKATHLKQATTCPDCGGGNLAVTGKVTTKSGQVNAIRCFDCFSGDQAYLTREGIRTFKDTVGTTQEVMAADGTWTKASIEYFGEQRLMEISFRPERSAKGHSTACIRRRVVATPTHRWLTLNRGEVTDLRVGDKVAFVGRQAGDFILQAFLAGLGFGDGSVDGSGRARIELCGDKDKQWVPLFEEYGHCSISSPPSCRGNVVVTFNGGHFRDWKQLPDLSAHDSAWLQSWLEGYLAADGHYKAREPGVRYLDSQNRAAIDFAEQIAPLAGYIVTGRHESSVMETNLGRRSAPLTRLKLWRSGLFRVTEVIETPRVEPVYCAVVPDGREFVLAHGIHTGNCGWPVEHSTKGLGSLAGEAPDGYTRQVATGGAIVHNYQPQNTIAGALRSASDLR